jgi:trans-2,3-dihydro-3-hydroxyanthranilate isomerase
MKLQYVLLDVFTDTPLAGNPLAVVLGADKLTDSEMQKIAAEFNLSETVFIQRPKAERHTATLRIFTPRVELPFAGHPTVGASVVLGLQQRISAVRLEETVGLITSVVEKKSRTVGHARFSLPRLPAIVGSAPEIAVIAPTLGLDFEDIGTDRFKPALCSAGVPFYLVPVKDADALARIRLERRGWDQVYPEGNHSVYVFTPTPEDSAAAFAARMFSPGMGIPEDPATGAAAAALLALLAPYYADGAHEIRLRQGREMGRPSHITLQLRKQDGVFTHGGIGGDAVIIGEGSLELPDQEANGRP